MPSFAIVIVSLIMGLLIFGGVAAFKQQQKDKERDAEQENQRRTLTENKRTDRKAEMQAHGHGGRTESYTKITGSLGENSDEGCAELDGVRLISHDCSYDDASVIYSNTELAEAVVVGEALAHPRFKGSYKYKH